MRLFRPIIALLMLAAAAPAYALVLPPVPTGLCVIDPGQDADRLLLPSLHLATQTPSDVLALYGKCAEIEYLRQGRMDMLTQYVSIVSAKTALANPDRATSIATLGAAFGLSGATSSKASTFEQRTPYRESVQRLVKQTDRYLVTASEQRHLFYKSQFAMVAVSGLTVIEGKLVAVNFYAPMRDANSIDAPAATVESYLTSLLAANP